MRPILNTGGPQKAFTIHRVTIYLKPKLNIHVWDLLNRPMSITNHLRFLLNMSSFNHKWRLRVLECHHNPVSRGCSYPIEGASHTKETKAT